MDNSIPEVIIASSNACSVLDANNSNEIISYKDQNTFAPKTLSLIGDDYLIGAYSNKPVLKVWTISSKKNEDGTFVVPGIVSALSVSGCGHFCIVGIKQQIYIWEVTTGDLLSVISRHYQPVTVLKFTADDSRFFSGSKDGLVIVWVLSQVIDVSIDQDQIKPRFVWNKHSGEITDIYCGSSVSRVATTSLDMTCKIFELESGLLLSTICMDVPLTCVVMDPLEYFVFLGDERGYLYVINTYERLPHVIHKSDGDLKAAQKIHEAKIISLSVTFDGRRLMTASEDRTCRMWDLQSLACLVKIGFDGIPTNAFLALKPVGLLQKNVLPQLIVKSFQKEFSAVPAEKLSNPTVQQQQELTLMYDGCPDEKFSNSVFCGGIKTFQPEKVDLAACEEIMQEAINGETVSNLTTVNNQIFSFALCENLNEMFEAPASPS